MNECRYIKKYQSSYHQLEHMTAMRDRVLQDYCENNWEQCTPGVAWKSVVPLSFFSNEYKRVEEILQKTPKE
mgnify:CR=1 FL=1